MMFSVESMEPTESVAHVHTFADLATLPDEERLALGSLKHVVQLKSSAPDTFEYIMPANVFKAFSPEAFKQAFQIPGETEGGRRSVLILPHSGIDPDALQYICDWMVTACNQAIPSRLQVQGNFFAWIELLKASMLLQVQAAQVTIWWKLANFITKEPLEWQHMETIMTNFSVDSKIVKHLIHNVSYRRNAGDITASCEFFINHDEFVKNLVNEVAQQQQQSAMASANAHDFAHWNQGNAAFRRQRFEEEQHQHQNGNQQREQPFLQRHAYQHIDDNNNNINNRRHFGKGRGNGHHRKNVNGAGGPQRREHDMEGWARRTAAAAAWDDSPAAHQGGAYDARALKPGEATAGGLIA
ncbi:uncharacterized protein BKCO1_12000132 [Diplodia corticola]|uniref:Uncharacterized protein n=1 Tax=Diplodia corticola TaxID=236234 RepID=A0A1J9R805_9PEZI|nr:uncharacterized protein BKCO1_12000132 [Diplodia corticola]OJD36330.1 hypothetical protein BKCO1_12000132 [Diplodia corticola]